jgi:AsmA protein
MTLPKLDWKIVVIALGGIVGALVLAAVLFIAFFPKGLAAREAERRIEAATGRDLVLSGAIDVTFWPALGFSVEDASLSNPEGFPTEHPFIAAEKIVFAVALLPLLRGDIEVRKLIFEDADLRLISGPDDDAAPNWAFPTEQTDDDGVTIEDLRLDDVRLTRGRISFQGAEGEPLVLENVDASLGLESLDNTATLNAAFDYRGERLTVESEIGAPRAVLEKGETPFAIQVRSALIDAEFDGAFQVETGALAGRIEASGASVRRLLAWVGSPMGEGGGFGRFRVSGQMAHVGERTELNTAAFRLDAIEATGNLALLAREDRPLRIDGALSAGDIDLNPYLPAPAQGSNAQSTDAAWSDAPLDLSGLRALDANLSLTLTGLRFQEMRFSNVALALRVAGGAADARLTRIALYGGAGTARLIADGSGATPRIAVELNADNIQAEPLLRDAIGFDSIVGRGRLTASLVGQGGSQAALMRSLRGNAAFNFNDGQWKGVNLAQVGRAVQALRGQGGSITGDGQGNATDFAELAATFAIIDGAAGTQDLRLLNPYVRLTGAGIINIGAQTIDMRLEPRAVASSTGQGGNAADRGYGIPFRVRGPWRNVSFQPALEEIVQNELRNIIAREARENPDNPLSQLAGALFGAQSPQAPDVAPTAPATPTPPANGEPAEQPAQQPAQQQQQPANPLADFLRRAAERERERQAAQPAPAEEKQGE